jgi:hypothetical protein
MSAFVVCRNEVVTLLESSFALAFSLLIVESL